METKLTGGGGGAVERGRAAFLESWKWGMRRGDGSPTLVGKHMNLLVKADYSINPHSKRELTCALIHSTQAETCTGECSP